MVETETKNSPQDAGWLDLPRHARLNAPVHMPVHYLLPFTVIAPEWMNMRVCTFLESLLAGKINRNEQTFAIALACVYAIHLPNRILDGAGQRDPRWNTFLFLELLKCLRDPNPTLMANKIIAWAATDPSTWDRKGGPLVFPVPKEIEAEIIVATDELERDDFYIALSALAESAPELINATISNLPSKGFYWRNFYHSQYQSAHWGLLRAEEVVGEVYGTFSFEEAVSVKREGFVIGLISIATTSWMIGDALFLSGLNVIPLARAQTTTSKHDFVPPIGLPLSAWVAMIVGFYLFLLVVLSVFLWQGYLAKPKNEKAAEFVKYFGTTLLGIFFGKLTS